MATGHGDDGGVRVVERFDDKHLGAGFDESDVDRVLWHNPVEFYGASGRLLPEVAADRDDAALFAGNSVLRGARPGA